MGKGASFAAAFSGKQIAARVRSWRNSSKLLHPLHRGSAMGPPAISSAGAAVSATDTELAQARQQCCNSLTPHVPANGASPAVFPAP
jgi:hypothetical protein